jgi:O-antigen ligase
MAAILLISFSIAYGRFFGIRQLRAGAAAAFLLIALVISQSRSATLAAAVAVVSIETSAVRFLKLRTWRGIAYAGVVACSSIALAWSYGPFRERVEPLINSPELVLAGGATTAVVATQGRSIAWPRLFAHAMEAPVIGHGMGTASAYTYSVTHNEHFSHPHNEYLRLLHDAGLIGLLSWLAGFLHTWTMARRVEDSAGSGQYRDAHALAAGIVGLIPAFLVLSLTDNIGFYTFVTVPFGILLGLIVAQRGRFLERPIQQSST